VAYSYGVATISRLLKITGLFCRIPVILRSLLIVAPPCVWHDKLQLINICATFICVIWIHTCDMPHAFPTTCCGGFKRVTSICVTWIYMFDMSSYLWHATYIDDDKLRPIRTCDICMWETDSYVWHGFISVTCHTHRWRQVTAQS